MSATHTTKYTFAAVSFLYGILIGILLLITGGGTLYGIIRHNYTGRVYPGVRIDGVSFSGKTPEEVREYWLNQNQPFERAVLELTFEEMVATVSGTDLNLGYDATLSATQAYSVGRSGNTFHDLAHVLFRRKVDLDPYFRWNIEELGSVLSDLSAHIDVPAQDALFTYQNGRVTAFRLSKDGSRVNTEETVRRIETAIRSLPHTPVYHLVIPLPVETALPRVTSENINEFGITELIGTGYSEFHGSIPGRIHNVALAASRMHGVLIPPGETFSFNETIGDISAATGYQSAYIIKNGRTVLGDGGGVCQVSTTVFRAALNAGLPIVERYAHAYRVHYYEEAGYKAGLDATVFSPSVDLRFTNDTPAHILIQAAADTKNMTLTINFYGTSDGRVAEIYDHVVYGESPPPPPIYQEDPTLSEGQIKQVDWAAWGAKASVSYRVIRNSETLQDTKFFSNFRPWQAVYLKGPNTPDPQ